MTSTPIIYTGKEVAVPNWNEFNRNFNARMAQISQQRQQQRQFEQLQKERRRKEFFESLDIDQFNFTSENLKSKQYQVVKGVEDYITNTLKQSDGDLSDEDLLKSRMLSGRAQQEIQKYANWEKNWKVDLQAAQDSLGVLYDEEKVKELIAGWDGNTPYKKSRLEQAFRDVSPEEIRARRFQKTQDPNYINVVGRMNGKDVQGREQYDEAYYNKRVDEDGNEYLVPDYRAQVGFLKSMTVEEEEQGLLAERAYDKQFNSLGDDLKKTYIEKAKGLGLGEDDAKYVYELDQAGGAYFSQPTKFKATEKQDPKTGGKDKRTVIDVTSGSGQFGDKSIVSSGTKMYFDKEGNKKKGTFRRGDLVYTDIEWAKNPETGDEEWMVKGYIPKAGEIDIPEDASESELVRAILQASAIKGERAVEEVRIPYEFIKEEMDRNYRLEGMDDFEPLTTTYVYNGAEYSEDEIRQAADALDMSVDAYVKKYKIKTQ
jgi:hypothetical protein